MRPFSKPKSIKPTEFENLQSSVELLSNTVQDIMSNQIMTAKNVCNITKNDAEIYKKVLTAIAELDKRMTKLEGKQ